MTSRMPPQELATAVSGVSLGHRVRGIDALRGLAVVLVVLHHINLRFLIDDYAVKGLLPGWIDEAVFWSGHYAVMMFFVISGFLITSLSVRRWSSLGKIPLLPFYRLRAARILPCLLVLLAVLSVLHWAGASDYVIHPQIASLRRALLAALTVHLNWLEGQRGYLPPNWDVLWSLSVEEAFYLSFPLLCLALRNERWIMICMLALIVIAPFNRVALESRDPWGEIAYLSCLDGIAFGCITAWITARVRLDLPVLRFATILGAVIAASVLVLREQIAALGLMKAGLDDTALDLGVSLILIGLAHGVGNALSWRGTGWLRRVGAIQLRDLSDPYVCGAGTHAPVQKSVWRPAGCSCAAYLATYALMLILSIVLGYAVERWLSDPMNKALRGP